MQDAGKEMAKAQQKNKEDFDSRIRLPKESIEPERFVFVRKEFYGLNDKNH